VVFIILEIKSRTVLRRSLWRRQTVSIQMLRYSLLFSLLAVSLAEDVPDD
jgi:hypothetical protein